MLKRWLAVGTLAGMVALAGCGGSDDQEEVNSTGLEPTSGGMEGAQGDATTGTGTPTAAGGADTTGTGGPGR